MQSNYLYVLLDFKLQPNLLQTCFRLDFPYVHRVRIYRNVRSVLHLKVMWNLIPVQSRVTDTRGWVSTSVPAFLIGTVG